MKKILLILVLSTSGLVAQVDVSSIQKEIDTTLWRPFQRAFEALDGAAVNAIYADQVLRITPSGIDMKGKFKAQNLKRFATYRKDSIKMNLDFWLDDRKTNQNTSYEVGFYRAMFTLPSGQVDKFYGQFHIVLEKIDGIWKITQDWDSLTINGKPLTAEDFAVKNAIRF